MPAPDSTGVAIRQATSKDLATMASWQCRFLPHGLFPQLGERFVRRWHATFIDAPYGIALIAELPAPGGPVPIGFLVGSTDQFRHIDQVLREHRIGLSLAGLSALAVRPGLCGRFLRTRARPYIRRILKRSPDQIRESPAESDPVSEPQRDRTAVVTAVAVTPGDRGTGAGRSLITRFIEQSRPAGVPKAELVTMVNASNDGFYEKLGWRLADEHTNKDGTRCRTFRYEFIDE
ncbi:GNAT family N-acetyltransferase [Arthrobacter sp. H14]|uniref:GNAT family N-acetyltransferase n=1 Tax=Arthrobacter sp. H14 TaxID=1312959 RepID=UPI00047B8E37|nr:GNAT family N-acetyltransferase [Arthrobacter sp. H14]